MNDLLHGIEFRPPEGASAAQQATVLAAAAQDAVARYVLDDERTEVFLDEHAQYAKWFSLVSPNEPTVAQRYDHDVFATIAKALRLARAEEQDGEGGGPSREARRAVEQFFSAGLAGSEILVSSPWPATPGRRSACSPMTSSTTSRAASPVPSCRSR